MPKSGQLCIVGQRCATPEQGRCSSSAAWKDYTEVLLVYTRTSIKMAADNAETGGNVLRRSEHLDRQHCWTECVLQILSRELLRPHLALVRDLGQFGEGERPLEDVVERLVTLLAPEGSEPVQQLVDQDPKTPPVHPETANIPPSAQQKCYTVVCDFSDICCMKCTRRGSGCTGLHEHMNIF